MDVDRGDNTWDVLVVGGGPAGLSAALVLGRCRRRVLLCDAGEPRNAVSSGVHGLLGHDGRSPAELRSLAREQLAPYPVRFAEGRVDDISGKVGAFRAQLSDGAEHVARRVLLAPGLRDLLPPVPGLSERYGKSVFSCPYCDGWEQRDRKLGALGAGEGAEELGRALLGWSDTVTVFDADGGSIGEAARARLAQLGADVVDGPLERLEGPGADLAWVVLAGGRRVPCEALFIKCDCTLGTDLAQRMGCRVTDAGEVHTTDACGRTCVDGIWVAGDASAETKMAVVAAAEGAQAAADIQTSLREEDQAVRLAAAARGWAAADRPPRE